LKQGFFGVFWGFLGKYDIAAEKDGIARYARRGNKALVARFAEICGCGWQGLKIVPRGGDTGAILGYRSLFDAAARKIGIRFG
jgi:hypothetical protein